MVFTQKGFEDPKFGEDERRWRGLDRAKPLFSSRRENEKGIEYEGQHYTMYEATQHQRKLERAIRKRKKKILLDEGLHDEQRLAQDQTKLVRLNEEYARFTKAAGLRSQRERTMVAGVGVKDTSRKRRPTVSAKTEPADMKKTLDNSADRGKIKVSLTDTDKKAIQDYMSAKSYVVNEKLRSGTPLTEDEQAFASNLDAALKKMPAYQGNLQRSLIFDSEEDVQAFLRVHTEGVAVKYDQYLSTTRGTTYNPDGQVQVLIRNSKRGRDISALNANESEVLYERGMLFRVVGVRSVNGKHYILMEESDE